MKNLEHQIGNLLRIKGKSIRFSPSGIKHNPKQVMAIEMKNGKVYETLPSREDVCLLKKLFGEKFLGDIFFENKCFVKKYCYVKKYSINGVGESFFVEKNVCGHNS